MAALTREEWLNSPAASPPLNIRPNFENPENIAGYSFPLWLIVIVFTNVIFLAKLWVLVRINHKMLVEDWLLTMAWLAFASAFTAFGALVIKLPVGMHQWDMKNEKFMEHMFVRSIAFEQRRIRTDQILAAVQ